MALILPETLGSTLPDTFQVHISYLVQSLIIFCFSGVLDFYQYTFLISSHLTAVSFFIFFGHNSLLGSCITLKVTDGFQDNFCCDNVHYLSVNIKETESREFCLRFRFFKYVKQFLLALTDMYRKDFQFFSNTHGVPVWFL